MSTLVQPRFRRLMTSSRLLRPAATNSRTRSIWLRRSSGREKVKREGTHFGLSVLEPPILVEPCLTTDIPLSVPSPEALNTPLSEQANGITSVICYFTYQSNGTIPNGTIVIDIEENVFVVLTVLNFYCFAV